MHWFFASFLLLRLMSLGLDPSGRFKVQDGGYGQPPQVSDGGYGQPPAQVSDGGYGQPPQMAWDGGYGQPPK